MNLRKINRRIRNFGKSDFKFTHEYQVQQDILRRSNFGKYNKKYKVWEFTNIKNQKKLSKAVESYMYQIPTIPQLKRLAKELNVKPTDISNIAQSLVDELKNRIGSDFVQYAIAEYDWDYSKLDTRTLYERMNLIYNTYTDAQIQELKDLWVGHDGF